MSTPSNETVAEPPNTRAFNAIKSFINDTTLTCDKYKPLKMYNQLINHTNINHTVPVQKHITAFTEFCKNNKDAILAQKVEELKDAKIAYSPKVFIDMNMILSLSSTADVPAIWKHLLFIMAIVCPTLGAKEVLKAVLLGAEPDAKNDDDDKEDDTVLEQLLEQAMNGGESANPLLMMDSIKTIVTREMASGNINPKKLMRGGRKMLDKMLKDMEDKPDADQARGMINMLIGVLSNMESGQAPDLSGLMGMLMQMMGGMGRPPQM